MSDAFYVGVISGIGIGLIIVAVLGALYIVLWADRLDKPRK